MPESRRWARFLTESAAIVASILVAFAIDAWWEGRQELAEEAELIRGLTQEFAENARIVDESLRLSLQGRGDLQRFLSLTSDELGASATSLTLQSAYEPFVRTWTVAPTVGFLQATISSGKIALIRDVDLRAALARFEGLQSDVSDVTWFTNELNIQAAKILGGFEEIRLVLSREAELSPDLLGGQSLSGETLRQMRENQELVGIGTAKLRYWDGYRFEVQRLRDNIAEILNLLDRQRGR